jgi:hypothetical protein
MDRSPEIIAAKLFFHLMPICIAVEPADFAQNKINGFWIAKYRGVL